MVKYLYLIISQFFKPLYTSCPENREISVGELVDCNWYGGNSGTDLECPDNQPAFGRCSTNQNRGDDGECNKLSQQVQCCGSDATVEMAKCGWIYDTFGSHLTCPGGLLATGFCGVNNKSDCNDGQNYIGIRCCPVAPA